MNRAVLTLVKPAPRPGPRALEFIGWAVDNYGEPHTSPGQVIVGRSQTALVAAHPTIDSHGTVSWYLRQLRDSGVVVGVRPVTVDLDAFGRFGGRPAPEPAATPEPAAGGGPTPELPSRRSGRSVADLLAQRAEQQARLAQLQAEIALTDAAIARALIGIDRQPGPATDTPELANDDSRDPRLSANDRLAELANQEGREVDLDNPPSFLNTKVANRDRETRESSRVDDTITPGEALGFGTVDELVEPLRSWCRTNGRIDHLDDTGRRTLAALGHAQLTAGVATVLREAAADPTIRRPIGLLIDRARKGHTETFRPRTPHRSPHPPIEPTFGTRDSRLDTEVLEIAASPNGLAAARNTLGTATTTTARQETDTR